MRATTPGAVSRIDVVFSTVMDGLVCYEAGDFGLGDLEDCVDGGGDAFGVVVLGAEEVHDPVVVVDLLLVEVFLGR